MTREPESRPLSRLGRAFFCPPFINAARASIRSDQIMLQDRLEIRLLANFLEESQAHFGIVDRHVARPQDGPALAFAVTRPQAGYRGLRQRAVGANQGSDPRRSSS